MQKEENKNSAGFFFSLQFERLNLKQRQEYGCEAEQPCRTKYSDLLPLLVLRHQKQCQSYTSFGLMSC